MVAVIQLERKISGGGQRWLGGVISYSAMAGDAPLNDRNGSDQAYPNL
jgi:hypothetical protein